MDEQLDNEMLKMVDVLLDMDVLEAEGDWSLLEAMEDAEGVDSAEAADGEST